MGFLKYIYTQNENMQNENTQNGPAENVILLRKKMLYCFEVGSLLSSLYDEQSEVPVQMSGGPG